MKISILGCGWYGLPLAEELLSMGHEVWGSTRTEEKKVELEAKGIKAEVLQYPKVPSSEILNSDVIVLNIPPFAEELGWFKEWKWSENTKIIFISSTSTLGESSAGKLLLEQEQWIHFRHPESVTLRFGGLLGNSRHPGKILSGKKNITGKDWPVNLIHLTDAIGFTIKILELGLSGETFEVVSDEHHTKKEFYQEFASRNNLPLPEFNEQDLSVGKVISNEKLKAIYQLHVPTMYGKSL